MRKAKWTLSPLPAEEEPRAQSPMAGPRDIVRKWHRWDPNSSSPAPLSVCWAGCLPACVSPGVYVERHHLEQMSRSVYNCTQFIRRETEARGDSITFPRAHSWWQGGNSKYHKAQADGCLKETWTWVFQTWIDKNSSWHWGVLVCARQVYTSGIICVHVEPLIQG